MYTCAGKPKHISVAIDKFNYALPYSYLVGGVFAIRTEQYQLINGWLLVISIDQFKFFVQ